MIKQLKPFIISFELLKYPFIFYCGGENFLHKLLSGNKSFCKAFFYEIVKGIITLLAQALMRPFHFISVD